MNFRVKLILNLAVISAVFIALFYLFFLPRLKLMQERHSELTEIRKRHSQLLSAASSYTDAEKLIAEEKSRSASLLRSLSVKANAPDIIHMLTSEITDKNMDIVLLKEGGMKTVSFNNLTFHEMELQVSLRTDFPKLIRFLREIYHKNTIIVIKELDISIEKSEYPVLNVNLKIIAYFS